jgi:hypothetical protein
MIDAKELKIGNWIEIFSNPYKVESINEQFIEATGYGRCWLQDVDPIKLTADILVKNDWELDHNRRDCTKFDDGYITIYEKGPNTFEIWLDDEKALPMYIHCVHEFQNVLSILGYGDLDIEL